MVNKEGIDRSLSEKDKYISTWSRSSSASAALGEPFAMSPVTYSPCSSLSFQLHTTTYIITANIIPGNDVQIGR